MSVLPDSYQTWVESALGARVVGARRTATGGSRQTMFVDLDDGRRVVVRIEGEGSFTGTEISLAREAAGYRAIARAGVPAPEVLAVHDDGSAFVMTCATGDSEFGPLDAPTRQATFDDFMDRLAELHLAPVGDLGLDAADVPKTAAAHATLDLSRWQRLSTTVAALDPLIAYAGAWLLAHPPARVPRTSFLQNDTGPGNFVAHDGRVSAFVDLEFWCVGDPTNDIAWVLQRSRPYGLDVDAAITRYEARIGFSLDPASLAYYALAVDYRCAVTTSLAVDRGTGARGLAPYVLQTQRYLGAIASQLSDLLGVVEEPPTVPVFTATPRTAWFDQLIADARNAVKAIADEAVRDQTRNTQIYLQYLRAYDAIGAEIDHAIDDDVAMSMPSNAHAARGLVDVAADAGRVGEERVLRCLLRRHARKRALWSALLDRPRR